MESPPASAPLTTRKSGTKITVVVRVRPPNQKEAASLQGNVIQVVDDHVLVFDPPGERIVKETFINNGNRSKNLSFGFDRVLGPQSSQEDVFDVIRKSIFDDAGGLLAGYNCTVFAYGATGSGKTFSMAGSKEHPGIMTRSVEYIFQALAAQTGRRGKLKISYLEIYNEEIRDLLVDPSDHSNSKPLNIVEDPEKGIYVTNISYCFPKDTQEVLELIQVGNSRRTQAVTDSNPVSSRSHAICQIEVENADDVPGLTTVTNVGKLSLIDLAGSERATTNTGCRLRETTKINQSLLALSKCLNALCTQHHHVPFRESKLTRLLHDSLGGNCRTVCLSCVSPSYLTYEDTYNTLQYADKAKNIRTNVQKNVINVEARVTQYTQMIAVLREQVQTLQNQIQNSAGIDEFKKSIQDPFLVQKHEIQRLFSQAYPKTSSEDDVNQEILIAQKMYIDNNQLKKRALHPVQSFIAECNRKRPSSSPNQFLENEQRIKTLELENFALKNNLDYFEMQIQLQQKIISQLTNSQVPLQDNSCINNCAISEALSYSGKPIQERLRALQSIPLSPEISLINSNTPAPTHLSQLSHISFMKEGRTPKIDDNHNQVSQKDEKIINQNYEEPNYKNKLQAPTSIGKSIAFNKNIQSQLAPNSNVPKTNIQKLKARVSISDAQRIKMRNHLEGFSLKKSLNQLANGQRAPLSARNVPINNVPEKQSREIVIEKLRERVKAASKNKQPSCNRSFNDQRISAGGFLAQGMHLNQKQII